jgi:hypothetical protein
VLGFMAGETGLVENVAAEGKLNSDCTSRCSASVPYTLNSLSFSPLKLPSFYLRSQYKKLINSPVTNSIIFSSRASFIRKLQKKTAKSKIHVLQANQYID